MLHKQSRLLQRLLPLRRTTKNATNGFYNLLSKNKSVFFLSRDPVLETQGRLDQSAKNSRHQRDMSKKGKIFQFVVASLIGMLLLQLGQNDVSPRQSPPTRSAVELPTDVDGNKRECETHEARAAGDEKGEIPPLLHKNWWTRVATTTDTAPGLSVINQPSLNVYSIEPSTLCFDVCSANGRTPSLHKKKEKKSTGPSSHVMSSRPLFLFIYWLFMVSFFLVYDGPLLSILIHQYRFLKLPHVR